MAVQASPMTGMSQTVRAQGAYWQGYGTTDSKPKPLFLILSAIFHAALLVIITGQFSLFKNMDDMEEMVVVEMVDAPISEKTAPPQIEPIPSKPATPPKTEVTKSKPSTPPKSETKPEPPKQTPPPEQDTANDNAAEQTPDDVPMPAEEQVEKPKPKAVNPPQSKPKPPVKKVEEKVEPKKEEKPKEDDTAKAMDFQSVLKNLAGDEAVPEAQDNEEAEDKPLRRAPTLTQPPPVSEQVSQSEMQALINQLAGCWNILPGARNAQNLYVDVYLEVNPDRTVRRASIVDRARYNNDDFFRAAADSALRAVQAPACTPLNLPPYKYEQWKTMTVRFDPQRMF